MRDQAVQNQARRPGQRRRHGAEHVLRGAAERRGRLAVVDAGQGGGEDGDRGAGGRRERGVPRVGGREVDGEAQRDAALLRERGQGEVEVLVERAGALPHGGVTLVQNDLQFHACRVQGLGHGAVPVARSLLVMPDGEVDGPLWREALRAFQQALGGVKEGNAGGLHVERAAPPYVATVLRATERTARAAAVRSAPILLSAYLNGHDVKMTHHKCRSEGRVCPGQFDEQTKFIHGIHRSFGK